MIIPKMRERQSKDISLVRIAVSVYACKTAEKLDISSGRGKTADKERVQERHESVFVIFFGKRQPVYVLNNL